MKSLKKYSIIDLHLHLDGSLSAKAIIEVAKEEGIKLPTYDEKELEFYLKVPKDCKSLNEYLERFDIPNLVLQTKNSLRKCTLDLLNRLSKQGLKYVEIRMAPQLSAQKDLTQEDVVKELIEIKKETERTLPIKVNFILCMMRIPNNKKVNLETVELAKKYYGQGIVAVDLAGAEAMHPFSYFEKVFNKANEYGLNITIHGGEATGSDEVMMAIDGGAMRIGHGVHLSLDKDSVKNVLDNDVCFEFCPLSNLQTKSLKTYNDVPLRKFMEKGIDVTINSDNMTVSNTDAIKEMRTMVKTFSLTKEEVRKLICNSIKHSFVDNDTQEKLYERMNEVFDSYYEKVR